MKRIAIALLLLTTPAQAQTTEPIHLGFEAPISSALETAALDYWLRYEDVRNDPTFGDAAGPTGAELHFQLYGEAEGRIWRSTLVGNCDLLAETPIVNGFNCVEFPNGGKITGISWQSSLKTFDHEVLFSLVMKPEFQTPGQDNTVTILVTHHVGAEPAILIKEVSLSAPLVVPFGWVVWVYAEGWSSPHNAGIEVQMTLWVEVL